MNADAYVQDGITYETIYLKGDSDPTQSRVILNGQSTKNYRYVLLDNWNLITNKVDSLKNAAYGNNIIFDLNGHVVTSSGYTPTAAYYLTFSCVNLEVTDSSTKGSGHVVAVLNDRVIKSITFSGNGSYTIESRHDTSNPVAVTVRGGQRVYFQNDTKNSAGVNYTVAPYMNVISNSDYGPTFAPSHDYYAVAESNQVTGIYNCEFSHAWNLTVGELAGLNLPADKTYYLWGRNADGAYAYLNIAFVNGAWSKIVA